MLCLGSVSRRPDGCDWSCGPSLGRPGAALGLHSLFSRLSRFGLPVLLWVEVPPSLWFCLFGLVWFGVSCLFLARFACPSCLVCSRSSVGVPCLILLFSFTSRAHVTHRGLKKEDGILSSRRGLGGFWVVLDSPDLSRRAGWPTVPSSDPADVPRSSSCASLRPRGQLPLTAIFVVQVQTRSR